MSSRKKNSDEQLLESLLADDAPYGDSEVIMNDDFEASGSPVQKLDVERGNDVPAEDVPTEEATGKGKALLISFLLMVVIGLGNKIFSVLLYTPMANYPLFVNLLTTFVYVPCSFAYIFPMIKFGSSITSEQLAVPKWNFAVMGLLDSIAGIMQSLGTRYLHHHGSLIILVQQAAIPVSMVISRLFLGTRYKFYQFVAAGVVVAGIITVLWPSLTGSESAKSDPNDPPDTNVPVWVLVFVLSCVPMCLSSVYKEKALGDVDLDPIYLNGWIAVYQFIASFPLLIPGAFASQVPIDDLPQNLWDGARCLAGQNSILHKESSSTHIDDCKMSPVYVCAYIAFNLNYNILIILILKYGSANVLWLAMTVMVPLANISFSLDFMPNSKPLTAFDIAGLCIIMFGLVMYRFFGPLKRLILGGGKSEEKQALLTEDELPPSGAAPAYDSINQNVPGTPATPAGSNTPMQGLGTHMTRKHKRKQAREEESRFANSKNNQRR